MQAVASPLTNGLPLHGSTLCPDPEHPPEDRLRRRLRGAEPETAFSQLACWEGLALMTPCLAALCWLVAQVTTVMEASRLGWTLARMNVALTGAPMPSVFVR